MKHPDHICRFNDGEQTCDCYDEGYVEGVKVGDGYGCKECVPPDALRSLKKV